MMTDVTPPITTANGANGAGEPPAKRTRTDLTSPEAGSVKYFVGQIPRDYDEERLKPIFEEFGPVFEISVIRHKDSGNSRGCCFLVFFKREDGAAAQKAMHNQITLPGMAHPVQMKPADSEKRNVEERKLFVGMLSKKQNEEDVIQLFQPYGEIDECTVLRDGSGSSKGCAFVTFATKQSAQNAIRSMHESCKMEGCSASIKVRLADTPRDKEMKRMREDQSRWSGGNAAPGGFSAGGFGQPQMQQQQANPIQQAAQQLLGSNPGQLALTQLIAGLVSQAVGQNAGQGGQQDLSGITNLLLGQQNQQQQQQQQTQQQPQQQQQQTQQTSYGAPPPPPSSSYPTYGAATDVANQAATGTNPSPYAAAAPNYQSTNTYQSTTSYPSTNSYGSTQQTYGTGASYGSSFSSTPSFAAKTEPTAAAPGAGKNTEGPAGANLFVYHLPQDFTDNDLANTFAPFGTVVSAKVFIDPKTSLSKCFGFVSYDNADSAQSAIGSMNGFQIGMRRLRVQLKTPKP